MSQATFSPTLQQVFWLLLLPSPLSPVSNDQRKLTVTFTFYIQLNIRSHYRFIHTHFPRGKNDHTFIYVCIFYHHILYWISLSLAETIQYVLGPSGLNRWFPFLTAGNVIIKSIHTQTMDVKYLSRKYKSLKSWTGEMCVAASLLAVSTGALCYHYAMQEEIVG